MSPSVPSRTHGSTSVAPDASVGALRFRDPEAYATYVDNPHLQKRNELMLSLLPGEARRVADLGCGPGIAARAISESGRRVWSLDASMAALRSLPPHPVCGSITELPFPKGSFDLAVSFELLEHLPPGHLREAAREIERVSRKWILIGVPHRENLLRNQLRCPRCAHEFNRSGHLNRFGAADLRDLFPRWRVLSTHLCGPPVRDYPGPLLWARHRIAGKYSEMGGRGGVRCPECQNDEFPAFRHNLLSIGLDGVNKLLSRRRPYWIIQLLEK